jgi:tetratricopeptide (TPR) repeat protein
MNPDVERGRLTAPNRMNNLYREPVGRGRWSAVRLALSAIYIIIIILAAIPAGTGAAEEVSNLDYLEAAFIHHRNGDYDQAIRLYTKVITSKDIRAKDRSITYLLRGEAKRDSGRPDAALKDFSRAIKIRPRYAQAYYFRGLLKEKQGDLSGALSDVKEAATIRPGNDLYQKRLTILKAKKEEQDEARAD